MREEPDLSLVEAVLEGDAEAFGLLIERYERQIFNLSYRITGSPDDAMDATQTAFTNAYQNLGRFDPGHRFFSWIYRIAVNASVDLVKRRREVGLPASLVAPEPGPEERFRSRETSSRVQRALLYLSEEHRTVIVLRHYLELSYGEIADVASVPVKTVRSRLYEARQQLRQVLLDTRGEH